MTNKSRRGGESKTKYASSVAPAVDAFLMSVWTLATPNNKAETKSARHLARLRNQFIKSFSCSIFTHSLLFWRYTPGGWEGVNEERQIRCLNLALRQPVA